MLTNKGRIEQVSVYLFYEILFNYKKIKTELDLHMLF